MKQLITITPMTVLPKAPYNTKANDWYARAEELQIRRWRILNAQLKGNRHRAVSV